MANGSLNVTGIFANDSSWSMNATNASWLGANLTGDDEEPSGLQPMQLFGMGIAALSTLCSTVGILIQKYSAAKEAGLFLCRRWRFWIGFTLNLGSEAGLSTLALYYTPMSLIAPLGGLGVIINALIVRFGLVCGIKESLSVMEWVCTIIALVGLTLVTTSGPGSTNSNEPLVIAELKTLESPVFIAYACVAGTFVLCWVAVSHLKCLRRLRPGDSSLLATLCSGATAATCGSFSVLFLKITATAVPAFIQDTSVVPEPIVFIAIVGLIIVAPLQLYLLNLSLAAGDASFAVPFYMCLLTVLISAMGGVVFNEFDALFRPPMPLYLVLYVAGLLLLLGGVAGLSFGQAARQKQEKAKETAEAAAAAEEAPEEAPAAASSAREVAVTVTNKGLKHCDVSLDVKKSDRCHKPATAVTAPKRYIPPKPANGGRVLADASPRGQPQVRATCFI